MLFLLTLLEISILLFDTHSQLLTLHQMLLSFT